MLGGEWVAVGEAFGSNIILERLAEFPRLQKKLNSYFSQAPTSRTLLQVFRRRTPAEEGANTGTIELH